MAKSNNFSKQILKISLRVDKKLLQYSADDHYDRSKTIIKTNQLKYASYYNSRYSSILQKADLRLN